MKRCDFGRRGYFNFANWLVPSNWKASFVEIEEVY